MMALLLPMDCHITGICIPHTVVRGEGGKGRRKLGRVLDSRPSAKIVKIFRARRTNTPLSSTCFVWYQKGRGRGSHTKR